MTSITEIFTKGLVEYQPVGMKEELYHAKGRREILAEMGQSHAEYAQHPPTGVRFQKP